MNRRPPNPAPGTRRSSPPGAASWSIDTPFSRPGPIAVVTVRWGDEAPASAAALFERLGIAPVPAGGAALRTLPFAAGEHGVVARVDASTIMLMPHAGPAVLEAIGAGLDTLGLARAEPGPAGNRSGATVAERGARAIGAAPSPRAIDLLLDQARRWDGLDPDAPEARGPDVIDDDTPEVGPALRRLLVAPTVAAAGAPNIGKSTLANALAGREIAAVADMPGTTRDHVGATIDLDGLSVRYADLPGLRDRPGPLESEAIRAARPVLAGADLVLLCGDAGAEPPDPESLGLRSGVVTLRVALRADLGVPAWGHDVAIALAGPGGPGGPGGFGAERAGAGLIALAGLIRRALVPDAALGDPRPWRFWDGAPGHGCAAPSA